MADTWADGTDLAAMSRSGNLLEKMGYDPDEVKASPALRAEVMNKVAGPYSATTATPPVQMAQNTTPARPTPTMPNPQSQNGNSIAALPGEPRLLNRQQPTVPVPPRPVPDTLSAAVPTQQSMATGVPPTSPSVSPSGTAAPATSANTSIETQNSRQAVTNLLAPEPDLPDTAKQDAMIAAKSVPINPNTPMYKEHTGGKIGRGFAAVERGLLTGGVLGGIAGGIDPASVGAKPYDAPNNQYGVDDQTRQAQLNLAQKQKADAMAKFKTMADQRSSQDKASKDAGDISNTAAKLPNETTTAQADMTRAEASTAEAYNNSPQGKAEAQKELNTQTLSTRQAQLSDPKNPLSKASTADKAYFTATGKLPDPDRYHAPPEQVQFDAAHSAWVAQHPGQRPGIDDIRSMVEAAKGAEKGTMMLVPDGKGGSTATMVHSGDAVPAGSTMVNGKGGLANNSGPAATVADKNRASLAHVAGENLDQVEDIINRRPEIVGKLGGQISQAKDLIGSNDPDLVALGNAVHNFAMANAGIHGSRSHENVVDAEKALINNMKSGVEGIRGGIKENRQNLQSIIDRVEGKPKTAPSNVEPVELHWGPGGKLTEKPK